jgi:universal stress protein A
MVLALSTVKQVEASGGLNGIHKKILAPTDLSDLSCIGLRHALEEVIVYYVIDLGDHWTQRERSGPFREMLECHKQSLDKFLREKFPEELSLTEVRQVVEFGAVDNIVQKAEAERVDRIVMSTHGRTGIDHLLIGSVSEKVIARASCPVLIMPAHKRKIARAA